MGTEKNFRFSLKFPDYSLDQGIFKLDFVQVNVPLELGVW